MPVGGKRPRTDEEVRRRVRAKRSDQPLPADCGCGRQRLFVANAEQFPRTTFTRSNPAADIYGIESFTSQKHWGCRGSLLIDALLETAPCAAPGRRPRRDRAGQRACCAGQAAARNYLRFRQGPLCLTRPRTAFQNRSDSDLADQPADPQLGTCRRFAPLEQRRFRRGRQGGPGGVHPREGRAVVDLESRARRHPRRRRRASRPPRDPAPSAGRRRGLRSPRPGPCEFPRPSKSSNIPGIHNN